MTETEKLILEKLDGMDQKFSGMDQKFSDLDQKISGMDQKISGMDQKISGMDQKISGMDQKIIGMDQKFSNLDQKIMDETGKIRIIIENEISKKIDIIGEGHDFLKQRLDEALQMEKKRESMELELINLRMDVKRIKEHLSIA